MYGGQPVICQPRVAGSINEDIRLGNVNSEVTAGTRDNDSPLSDSHGERRANEGISNPVRLATTVTRKRG